MGKVFKHGESRVNGEVTNMMVNLKVVRDVDMGYIIFRMGKLIRETGRMEIGMAMVLTIT